MTKTIFICLICLLSVGCSAVVSVEHFEDLIAVCSKNGGLNRAKVTSHYAEQYVIERAYCNDGAEYPLDASDSR